MGIGGLCVALAGQEKMGMWHADNLDTLDKVIELLSLIFMVVRIIKCVIYRKTNRHWITLYCQWQIQTVEQGGF